MELNVNYERNLNHTYMICKGIVQDSYYEMQMLLNNRIPGLLPCRMEKIDGNADLYYEITSKQSLDRMYEKKKMDFVVLQKLFADLYQVLRRMEEYLLPLEVIIMMPHMIYADIEKMEFYFCAVPGIGKSEDSLQRLLEFLLNCIDYTDEKAVATAYEWYKKAGEINCSFLHIYQEIFVERNVIVQEENYHSSQKQEQKNMGYNEEVTAINDEDEDETIAYEEKNKENEIKINKFIDLTGNPKLLAGITLIFAFIVVALFVVQGEFSINQIFPIVFLLIMAGGIVYYKKNDKGNYELGIDEENLEDLLNEEDEWAEEVKWPPMEKRKDTTVSEKVQEQSWEREVSEETEYGETVFFKNKLSDEERKLEAVSQEYATFNIEIFPFIIGKLCGAVDGIIDDETVSRIHCKIEKEEGKYYITDLNSTNGTIVNGEMLDINEKVQLEAGDEVQLGKVVYVFR